MNKQTLQTSLIYLSVGCLVISILEIITRGLSYAYIWLMISVILWLGYNYFKKKGEASAKGSSGSRKSSTSKAADSSERSAAGKRSSESKPKRKRR